MKPRRTKALLPRTKYYVLHIWRGVSPELIGPFYSSKERSRKLTRVLEKSNDQDSVFALHVTRSGRVSVAATPNLDAEASHSREKKQDAQNEPKVEWPAKLNARETALADALDDVLDYYMDENAPYKDADEERVIKRACEALAGCPAREKH